MSLASAAGATVGLDPRSADFAKIKIGNTRYDLLGGMQQNVVLAARLLSGEKINSETGELDTLGDGVTTPNRIDLLYSAFENKENPLLAFATRLLKTTDNMTKDAFGNDFNLPIEAGKLIVPLNIQGIVDTSIDTGNVGQAVGMSLPGFVGAGVQTYGNIPSKNKGTKDGKAVYSGQVEPNMVTDDNGQVILDTKGKPVTVKFDKDATPLEIEALKDAAKKSALSTQFKNAKSKEDQALMKLSSDDLSSYVSKGKISQEKADKIESLKKQADNANGIKMPKGVTTPYAREFYLNYNSKTKKEQSEWLDSAPDKNAKTIAEKLNKSRVKGLDEFKPSNRLSQLYSDYESDIQSHPEYTKVDKQNKAKEFQSKAFRLNYSTNQQDIYNEGGSSDLKQLIADGQITKEDLDKAIEIDDRLYASGLTGSKKFSNKFRSGYGYSGGSGGSSGGVSQHLGSYLPSSKSEGVVPKFSSKPRTTKLNLGNFTTPKSGKKINIKL